MGYQGSRFGTDTDHLAARVAFPYTPSTTVKGNHHQFFASASSCDQGQLVPVTAESACLDVSRWSRARCVAMAMRSRPSWRFNSANTTGRVRGAGARCGCDENRQKICLWTSGQKISENFTEVWKNVKFVENLLGKITS